LSVAGLPPLVGFHVQRLLVLGLIGDGRWPLAVAMICVDLLLVTAVVGAFRQSFLRAEPAPRLRPASGWLSLQLSLSVAALVALGVFPGPLARWAAALFSTALGVSP
jgi:NADH:ubiquinone oxidoreductase subunit 2 (subunit N)